jgi:putative sigma-54 modulation protein
MQITITGRQFDITDALKKLITEKLERVHHRDQQITTVTISLHVENLSHTADATLHCHGTEIHASATSEDMYKSIDQLIDKLITQITKHKEKIIDSHR